MKDEKMMNEIEITNLADDQDYLEEASLWLWEEWGKEMGKSLENIVYRTKHSICKDRVPQTYIARLDDQLAGVVSLWSNDLATRQDLYPWLSILLIKEEYRGKGIGTLLQKKCIEAAKELGYEHLYLTTEHDHYYERTGWEFLGMMPVKQGEDTRVYKYEISRG